MLIGHQKLLDELLARHEAGQLPHALLFLGPAQVGKTTLALHLATKLQEASNPVKRKQIWEGLDVDTILFLDEGGGISIKEVRAILKRASESKASPYLIFVIEDLGRMSLEAMNALLKTLEEPLPGVLFLLTAHHEEDLLPTVLSRVQVHRMSTVADADLADLASSFPERERALFLSAGKPGKMKRMQNDEAYREAVFAMHEALLQFVEEPTVHGAFELARTYEKDERREDVLDLFLLIMRRLALSESLLWSPLELADLMEAIERCKVELGKNVNAKLALETLFLEFTS